MDGILNKVVGIGIGLTVLFLLLNSIVMPNYNTAGSVNTTVQNKMDNGSVIAGEYRTMISTAGYQGLLLLVFVLAIIGVALTFLRKK